MTLIQRIFSAEKMVICDFSHIWLKIGYLPTFLGVKPDAYGSKAAGREKSALNGTI